MFDLGKKMSKRTRALVIGAAGFIGQNLVKHFLELGIDVIAFDVVAPPQITNASFEWVVGSLLDESLVSSIAAECESVFYLASNSLPATANADLASEISQHVRLAVKTAEISQAMGAKKFVFASSGGTVYGLDKRSLLTENDPTHPINAYGVSKLSIEKYISLISRLHNFQTISLRISNPYGQLQRAAKGQGVIAAAIKAGIYGDTLPIWGDMNIVRDFIYIDDVVKAFAAAYYYDGPSEIINIGSGRGTSLLTCLSTIEKFIGKKIDINIMPSRSIDVKSSVLCVEKASNILKWLPNTSFENGVHLTSKWWIEKYNSGTL